MFTIRYTPNFKRRVEKVIGKDTFLQKRLAITIKTLSLNPFQVTLRTHKAHNPLFGKAYSSTVTGDIRVFWDFDGDNIILLLTIGKHSGKYKISLVSNKNKVKRKSS